eukprot:CAMPEP_0168464156 /NCGR_PEP_ID=MMETSP0228-20121227/55427_1 /TAXON_ID=133427 /ORGANISM="Protoceratium reticulatum, Strain CCCM 535 (=CCMP 1889)" /LENGTH=62 /DNA_ID=CAMNT_0008479637 /DNA_START=406 /DNA_END=594 /DNA_ORIENTATION=+
MHMRRPNAFICSVTSVAPSSRTGGGPKVAGQASAASSDRGGACALWRLMSVSLVWGTLPQLG